MVKFLGTLFNKEDRMNDRAQFKRMLDADARAQADKARKEAECSICKGKGYYIVGAQQMVCGCPASYTVR